MRCERKLLCLFFFFQAEDGIRDLTVTGVQTCALPILPVAMQQKYCDHGRSVALFTTTRPTFFARSSCGIGGKPRKASILPSARSFIDTVAGCVTQVTSRRGSTPTCASMLATNV